MVASADLERGMRFTLHRSLLENGGYDEKTSIGLAIDVVEKERFALAGAAISDCYAPHDFCMDGVYHDIKSSRGRYLSISEREYLFARAEVRAGRDVIYVIYLQDPADALTYEYLGRASFKALEGALQFGSSPYWSLTTVKQNLL